MTTTTTVRSIRPIARQDRAASQQPTVGASSTLRPSKANINAAPKPKPRLAKLLKTRSVLE